MPMKIERAGLVIPCIGSIRSAVVAAAAASSAEGVAATTTSCRYFRCLRRQWCDTSCSFVCSISTIERGALHHTKT